MKSIFINPDSTREYYLLADSEHSYKFTLGVIDSLTMFHVRQTISNAQETAALLSEYLRYGLKGVEGPGVVFETEQIEVPYLGTKTVVKRSFIEGLSRNVIEEIAHEIAVDNTLVPTGEETKN